VIARGRRIGLTEHNKGSKDSDFVRRAVSAIAADLRRSADTHLVRLRLPCLPGVSIYLKDESTHPSGSLKHRLARSLFLYGLCNGWIRSDTTIVEASSGSTAISEAYFAQLIGLPFVAVVPDTTANEKIAAIKFCGGACHLVPGIAIYDEAKRLANQLGGHYMDQFTYAERATDWRSNNNIAESIFAQMALEQHSLPSWIIVSAGTGGTSSTIGRYIRYDPDLCGRTRVLVVDPERSVFRDYWRTGDRNLISLQPSRIEGIGRPRVEPSFLRDVVDDVITVPDAASIATIHWLEDVLGRKCGGSTGTNLWGTLQIAAAMHARGETGSLVTLICDSGERYRTSYYNPEWIAGHDLNPTPWRAALDEFSLSGRLVSPSG
jgi:cysteine synthase